MGGTEWVRERGRLLKREREKDEKSMRMGKERRSPGKTDVPKLYTYNECELSVEGLHTIKCKEICLVLGVLGVLIKYLEEFFGYYLLIRGIRQGSEGVITMK